ncbi:toll/interleukin-1 receptor domain-containing protein [Tistrella mobilis]|uniref:toll/interleukin-1 receptor domain-containing protein n=1 Tax=Tistrella mobilis TaxID=171437 RepID=UPI00355838E5
MSNVFISHASEDKPFVLRLAVGLLAKGIPVWLDKWSITLGDSLLDAIYDGLERSGFVVVVVSDAAIRSGWVNRELNAALAREEQTGRRFVIPIRIDDTNMPLKVADRLYANFATRGFSEALEDLARVLVSKEAAEMAVPPEREVLPLRLVRPVDLDMAALEASWKHMRRRHPDLVLSPEQVVLVEEPEYGALRRSLHHRIDGIAQDPDYTPEVERHLKDMNDLAGRLEVVLRTGVAELLNRGKEIDAVLWFAKIIRARALYRLWTTRMVAGGLGQGWKIAGLDDHKDARDFFGTDELELVDLWRDGHRNGYFILWLPRRDVADLLRFGTPQRYYDGLPIMMTEHIYVYPQMLAEHLCSPLKTREPVWDLAEAIIGLH